MNILTEFKVVFLFKCQLNVWTSSVMLPKTKESPESKKMSLYKTSKKEQKK